LDIYKVEISEKANKDLQIIPVYVVLKLQSWIEAVGISGLRVVRKIVGYHDEPLKGKRDGQRSIRLSKAYRAIYVVDKSQAIHFVEIVEVNKHDY
jgi:toxin HigB-1